MRCLFGGTFDPVHLGHLSGARAAAACVGAAEVRMLLAARPGHRSQPGADVSQRWEMLRLACADDDLLVPDDFEIQGERTSYTVETLERLRAEFGPVPFFWVMGMDAFAEIETWHRASEVLDLCHLVLLKRPGAVQLPDALAEMRAAHRLDSVPDTPAGGILEVEDRMPEISATDIRARLAADRPVEHLLPAGVLSYIRGQGLYR